MLDFLPSGQETQARSSAGDSEPATAEAEHATLRN